MNFKEFVQDQIDYYVLHFKKKRVLLDLNGDIKHEVNLSFEYLSDQYLLYLQEHEVKQEGNFTLQGFSSNSIKITDNDLLGIWEHIDASYHLSFNIQGQDISDQTILKISELYIQKRCAFSKLKLSGNARITGVGIGKLGQSLQDFPQIEEIYLHGLTIFEGGIKYAASDSAGSSN